MITSSEFYSKLNTLETNRQLGIAYLKSKNIEIEDTANIPTIIGKIASIPNPGEVIELNINTSGSVIILAAELANRTIQLYDAGNTLISTQVTDINIGGVVSFGLSDVTPQVYTLKALDNSSNELWSTTLNVTEVGIYNCKSPLKLEGYTWEEINITAKNHYAKYMFDLWDSKPITSFMGSTNLNYRTAYIIGFDQDDATSGGKAGITFMFKASASNYKHWNSAPTNINGISWVGSLIRTNCMKVNEIQYIYDPTVTANTSGTYFILQDDNTSFTTVTLPAEYNADIKYYKGTTLSSDGAFIAGLTDINNYIVQVNKKTWGGYGPVVTSSSQVSSDNTIIITQDWMFLPSDSEIFGDGDRYNDYSKFALEGEQYQAFELYKEDKFRFSDNRWFRSPCLSLSNPFCTWYSNGYVGYASASNSNKVGLCFCI